MHILMGASHDQMDRVDRARLVESCGACDDSPSWNLGRVGLGDTIRVRGMSPRGQGAEGREGVRSRSCFRVQQAHGQAAERGRMHGPEKNDVGAARIPAAVWEFSPIGEEE